MNSFKSSFPFFLKQPGYVDYHRSSKLEKFKLNNPKHKNYPKEWLDVNFKGYPRFEKYKLPNPIFIEGSFTDILNQRHSVRKFSTTPLAAQEVSNLLHYSAGQREPNKPDPGNRYYPSAGGRYPCEIYPIFLNVGGFHPGIYHYHVRSHGLEFLWKPKSFRRSLATFIAEKWTLNSGIILLISAVIARNTIKYKNRGYRHVLMEVGILIHNIYLTTTALNLGCCAVGGFIDDGLNNLLDLDGEQETIMAVVAIGKKNI